jgi:hypothetical protein
MVWSVKMFYLDNLIQIFFVKFLEIAATIFGGLLVIFALISAYKVYRVILFRLKKTARADGAYQDASLDLFGIFRKLFGGDIIVHGDMHVGEKFKDATPEEKQYLLLEEYHNGLV